VNVRALPQVIKDEAEDKTNYPKLNSDLKLIGISSLKQVAVE